LAKSVILIVILILILIVNAIDNWHRIKINYKLLVLVVLLVLVSKIYL